MPAPNRPSLFALVFDALTLPNVSALLSPLIPAL
jgi:hypothetical protein